MSTRPKSIQWDNVTRNTPEFPSGKCLDPSALLSGLLPHFHTTNLPISVNLSDGTVEVAYSLMNFLSKNYEISNNLIHFGFKRLKFETLRVSLIYELEIDSIHTENSNLIKEEKEEK
jgi:hypothetical protein